MRRVAACGVVAGMAYDFFSRIKSIDKVRSASVEKEDAGKTLDKYAEEENLS